MLYDSKRISDIVERFRKGRDNLNETSIEIVDGENQLDPLTLLRAYENTTPTIDSNLELTSRFVMGKAIKFYQGDKLVFETVYTGGDLSSKFKDHPYYLDLLLKLSYGMLIKKLTPPSEDSESEERQ